MFRFILALLLAGLCSVPAAAQSRQLTVMTFNAWGAGANNGKSIAETVAVLRKVNPDIIGMQETRAESRPCTAICPPSGPNRAEAIAHALGYYVYVQKQQNDALWANAVFSRYPILGATPHDLGVILDVRGRKVVAFNLHLTDFPYQPYQLLGIPYPPATLLHSAKAAEAAARKARGPALALWKSDLATVRGADAIFVCGDFNEPSWRDWTARAVRHHRQPMVVRYPSARTIESMGFTDALRAVYTDEITKPAFTWTPTTAADDPKDHHDRIDYIFARGSHVKVKAAGIAGEKAPQADVVVTPWSSDHRAVFAKIAF